MSYVVIAGNYAEVVLSDEEKDRLTAEAITAMHKQAKLAAIQEKNRPLSADEVTRLIIRQQVNSLSIDDATASRMVDYFPELTADGSLVKVGTRINWHGTLKQAAVDLWDTAESNPDNAPTLWTDLAYKDGFRIIPDVITVTSDFSEGECGWWGAELYRSKVDANVYTPEQYPANWEAVTI